MSPAPKPSLNSDHPVAWITGPVFTTTCLYGTSFPKPPIVIVVETAVVVYSSVLVERKQVLWSLEK
jgi:hypothetical protein